MNNKIIFITGNMEKVNIAKAALKDTGVIIENRKIKCPEIQSDDTEEIVKYSARYASNELKSNVIKTDSGLFIESLNGFPGPYSEYVERKLDAKEILNLMQDKSERKAYYKEVLAYCEYKGEITTFTTYTYGNISTELSGENGWNFDRIFIVDGDENTIANYDDIERAKKYSHDNWKNLLEYLKNKDKSISI
ncbi:MAG: non-canonical purine NTP pyrophosphatase [Clostridia bacterium]|nr:non-canonical purine NTP pyrophosphatase [Clostridia bacterium]